MDKQEYKIKAEEIKSLIAKRDFFKAVKIADEIDWKRVRSVAMLCTVSDLYKVNRRYKESKELLLMAYERHPNGRMIVYSLCELCIKMGEVVQAIEYYKEFVQLAPMDNGKYVLQYKLYVAQDVSLEERIAVLEELKKRDYREKWGYELAYLYHRIGLSTKCVEECDELILWFSDGRYVKKAMELKMLHQPLTAAQEKSYNSFIGKNAQLPKEEPVEEKPIEEQIQVQPVNVGQYDTINLQKELAESMKEVLRPVVSDPVKEEPEKPEGLGAVTSQIMAPMYQNTNQMKEIFFEDKTGEMVSILPEAKVETEKAIMPVVSEVKAEEEPEVVEPEESAEEEKAKVVVAEEPAEEEKAEVVVAKEPAEEEKAEVVVAEEPAEEEKTEVVEPEEPAKEEKAEVVEPEESAEEEKAEVVEPEEPAKEEKAEAVMSEEKAEEEAVPAISEIEPEVAIPVMAKAVSSENVVKAGEIIQTEPVKEEAIETVVETEEESKVAEIPETTTVQPRVVEVPWEATPDQVPDDATKEIPSIKDIMRRPLVEPTKPQVVKINQEYTAAEIPASMADLLSQEYDGQISLVVEEKNKIEKQITGQMNIEDVLIEWEKTKKEYEEKRKAERTKKVLEETGSMFTEFEAKIRDGILEQLQKEAELAGELNSQEDLDVFEEEIIIPELEETSKFDVEEILLAQIAQDSELENEEPSEFVPMSMEEEPSEEVQDDVAVSEEVAEELQEETSKEEVVEEKAETENAQQQDVEDTLKKIQQAQEEIRELSEEEKTLFAPFIQTKGARRRFMKALDLISLAAYTGNVIVTGEADSDTVKLAKNIMKDIQMTDSNFSGVIAKVSGSSLNSKSIEGTISKLNNGGLIIEKASGMNSQAVMKLLRALNQEKTGIVVILEDTKKAMKRMLAAYPSMNPFFNARVEIEELNNDALAAYGRQYAAHREYTIDDLGMLALQTLIEDRQTSDHIVTVAEVRELVDDAIDSANRKTLSHFFDIIFGRRYDDEDMIILREKDFM